MGLAWLVAAPLLWRSRVPGDLNLPSLDPSAYFSASERSRAEYYERFLRIDIVFSLVATIVALLVLVRRAPRLARNTGLGPIGAGMIVGMITLAVVWAVNLPFNVAARWWDQRHGLAEGSWIDWLVEPWAQLGGEVVFVMLQIAIVMLFARRFPRHWWLPVTPIFLGLASLALFVSPYLFAFSVNPPKSAQLRQDVQTLERKEGISGTPVDVEKVSNLTTQANAFAAGLGPTTRVVIWDTLLDGRFSRGEIRFVLAHEFGHVARGHLWKGIGWAALFAFPLAFALAQITRRRGGLDDPGVLPYGVLALVVLQVAFTPAQNLVSRHIESEADWVALQTTRDPASGRGLFERFQATSLQQPDPPTWSYIFLDTHPTLMQRIAMAEAWKRRNGR
ncbi:MAG: M48 family metalloprotease [Actinomycetota bacterium]